MGASVVGPESADETAKVVEVDQVTGVSVSTTEWDPSAVVFAKPAVRAVQGRATEILHDLTAQRHELEAAGADLGLARDATVDVPPDWAKSPGSPAYYLRVAEGYMRAVAEGTVCRYDFPESFFENAPPPPERWLCGHTPPHPR